MPHPHQPSESTGTFTFSGILESDIR
ncbi:MAG: hypothetical protein H6Q32_466, partial [Bacteroidetes bacterium]|nr:hypothetical protein [Bacteroidota bacterium]